MPHPKPSEIYPIGTTVIWTRPSYKVFPKVVRAVIVGHGFQSPDSNIFLNYEIEIEGKPGERFAAYQVTPIHNQK